MSDEIGYRAVQTKIKHHILESYIGAWGGIILNGLASRVRETHFVYVDCNASFGRYNGEIEDLETGKTSGPVFGSPIIGIQAIDKLIPFARERGILLRTNVILVELDLNRFEELKKSLDMAGYHGRFRETKDFSSLGNHEIGIVLGDSTQLTSDLVNFTQDVRNGKKFSLYFLDPYGPKALPLNGYVNTIISQSRHDVIINMPYQDLHKKTGIVTKNGLADKEKKILDNFDLMFGNATWQRNVECLEQSANVKEIEEWMYDESIDQVKRKALPA